MMHQPCPSCHVWRQLLECKETWILRWEGHPMFWFEPVYHWCPFDSCRLPRTSSCFSLSESREQKGNNQDMDRREQLVMWQPLRLRSPRSVKLVNFASWLQLSLVRRLMLLRTLFLLSYFWVNVYVLLTLFWPCLPCQTSQDWEMNKFAGQLVCSRLPMSDYSDE